MFPVNREAIEVGVEYAARGSRVLKVFPTMTAARRFYIQKTEAGADPRIVRQGDKLPSLPTEELTMSKKTTTTAPATKTTVETAGKGEYGMERSHDLPWNDKKVGIFKALKALKAVGQGAAVSVSAVAEKASLSARDVRHYVYHAMAAKLTGVVKQEGVSGYAVFLTANGAKVDPVAAMKAQDAPKPGKTKE